MKIVTLCGSARPDSSNRKLLTILEDLWPEVEFTHANIHELPLFADLPDRVIPAVINEFKGLVAGAGAVVVTTPEYAHNLPAALKNALEWLVAGGELAATPTLAITLTPHPPRGEKAMTSLVWTLRALDARVVAELPLFRDDLSYTSTGKLADCAAREMLMGAYELLD
jgi:NAD(P)H-dependent FMN reductase